MSLRVRLNLLITALFLVILLGSSFYVIHNARIAVKGEMESTANLTLQLMEAMLASAEMSRQPRLQQQILDNLSRIEATRNLQIHVVRSMTADNEFPPGLVTNVKARAPAWFVKLVSPRPVEFRKVFSGPNLPYTVILIRTDPSHEISESWSENRNVLITLLIFIVSANILVFFTLGRELAPVATILEALESIEKGDYQLRLPHFKLTELNSIAEKFNHMAEVLQRSRDENRYLTQQSLKIQEQERRRLARELHDELGQSLSALKAVAVSIENNSQIKDKHIRDSARTIIEFTDRMYEVARSMMRQLRPGVMDELGLRQALLELTDQWNESYQNKFCHLECEGNIDDLEEQLSINLFRIIQEGLTNIAKHAEATDAHVLVRRDNEGIGGPSLEVRIRDDGVGIKKRNYPIGMGLLGMRERVEAMNGSFELHSQEGEGTTILIRIPLLPEAEIGEMQG
jgi:two-component system sensor histidine kinase UhpB